MSEQSTAIKNATHHAAAQPPAGEPIRSAHGEGIPEVIFVGKPAIRWPNAGLSGTWQSKPDERHSVQFTAHPAPTSDGGGVERLQSVHPDDIAVDGFANVMSAKLATKRALGYCGWDDKEQCSAEHLSRLLRQHVEKGDPVDVANFAMMLHQRGERITPGTPAPQPGGVKVKALEWKPVKFAHGALTAECCVGRYELSRTFDGLIASLHSAEMHHIGESGEDHLKALCQADFERRVNADLLPVAGEV